MSVRPDQFDAFFHALWDYDPFPWQRRLALRVCNDLWPEFIDLPTASGKTACLDVAVFALAVQASRPPAERTIGRRVFFVVNRRVIVDEAYNRAGQIARALQEAKPDSILHKVTRALRQVSGDDEAPPLDVAMMRGGIVRDNRWARSITQPTIIISTIDQVGSRLLFRGYGVSEFARPMHAALIAQDSTILLDEAHISQPFVETLDAVRRYRGANWSHQPLQTPFTFVKMTATPGDTDGDVFRLDDTDRRHPVLSERHEATKPVTLHLAKKAKGKNAISELAAAIVEQAVKLQMENCRTIAVVVNRIATAQTVHEKLSREKKGEASVHLAIGRMRPIDRDDLTSKIQQRVGGNCRKTDDESPMFVVATQCLEVGADFDFDAMISECASLDALRQRFGRLNRRGRPINAEGCIVVRADQTDADDPIYGPALSGTWQWLRDISVEGQVDFGINAMNAPLKDVETTTLLTPRSNAPVMFPAYVDAWAQTSPAPAPDPDIALFLHGPQRGEPEVWACWREDLHDDADAWAQIVSLCPPSSPECMPVPIGLMRAWLSGQRSSDEERSDLLDSKAPESEEAPSKSPCAALAWRGTERSKLIRDPRDLIPGDTIVLPVGAGGWDVLGHVPPNAQIDLAERAFRQSHGLAILRLTPKRLATWPKSEPIDELRTWIADAESDLRIGEVRDWIAQIAQSLEDIEPEVADTMRLLSITKYGLDIERYPDGTGVVLRNRRRVPSLAPAPILPVMDDGEDEGSRLTRETPVPLDLHLRHVRNELSKVLTHLAVGDTGEALIAAADLHDWGKADERFQALLINGDRNDAWAQPTLWAKSARMSTAIARRRAARRRSGLPDGFRHEMLSMQLASGSDRLPADPIQRDLILHLIAAHHGRGRPFAPVVIDDDPPEVTLDQLGLDVILSADRRTAQPPHRLDSGIPERFWSLTRRFGWWGLAYLEAILRLADQRASQREDEPAEYENESQLRMQETAV